MILDFVVFFVALLTLTQCRRRCRVLPIWRPLATPSAGWLRQTAQLVAAAQWNCHPAVFQLVGHAALRCDSQCEAIRCSIFGAVPLLVQY